MPELPAGAAEAGVSVGTPGDRSCGILGCWHRQLKARLCWDAFPAPCPCSQCTGHRASLLRQKKPHADPQRRAGFWQGDELTQAGEEPALPGSRGADLNPPATSISLSMPTPWHWASISHRPGQDATGCSPCPKNLGPGGWSRRVFASNQDGLARHTARRCRRASRPRRSRRSPLRGFAKCDPKTAARTGRLQTPLSASSTAGSHPSIWVTPFSSS